jgi:two-component system LytT family response regulator
MLNIILIDDEPIGLNTLKVMIERLNTEAEIVATASDPLKGISLIHSLKPDAVFLDIQMPGMNGFDLLEKLQFKNFKLVFTTAHEEYAIKALRKSACDYLLKPIDHLELRACIEKMIEEKKTDQKIQKPGSYLELHVNDGIVLIKQSNIIRLEASGSYTTLFLKDGSRRTASKNLKHFESTLDPNIFYRSHQSYIINMNELTKLVSNNGYYAIMSDNSIAEVGKRNKEELLMKLKSV